MGSRVRRVHFNALLAECHRRLHFHSMATMAARSAVTAVAQQQQQRQQQQQPQQPQQQQQPQQSQVQALASSSRGAMRTLVRNLVAIAALTNPNPNPNSTP